MLFICLPELYLLILRTFFIALSDYFIPEVFLSHLIHLSYYLFNSTILLMMMMMFILIIIIIIKTTIKVEF